METSMKTQDEALKLIAGVLKEVQAQDMILTPETLIRDIPGWDSLAQVHVISVLEETFHIMIPLEEIMDMKTIGDILKYLD
jgi:acyl carrier protein